jgi:hypothetical protein
MITRGMLKVKHIPSKNAEEGAVTMFRYTFGDGRQEGEGNRAP